MTCRHQKFMTRALLAITLLLPLTGLAGGVTVHTLDGKTGGLGDHLDKSKWTLVMVWTTYCSVCRRQYPVITEFHDKHHASDAVVLGISLDGKDHTEEVRAYREKMQHSFPSVIADSQQFGELYEKATGEDFTGTPTYLLFDKDGGLHAYLDGPITLAALDKFIGQ